jgi:hypothetical protein
MSIRRDRKVVNLMEKDVWLEWLKNALIAELPAFTAGLDWAATVV